MRSFLWVVAGASLLIAMPACSAHTYGPVVRDIRADGAGRLIVETCNVEGDYKGQRAEMVQCSKKTLLLTAEAEGNVLSCLTEASGQKRCWREDGGGSVVVH